MLWWCFTEEWEEERLQKRSETLWAWNVICCMSLELLQMPYVQQMPFQSKQSVAIKTNITKKRENMWYVKYCSVVTVNKSWLCLIHCCTK